MTEKKKKTKYNFRTAANLALLCYCASVFKDGWLAMDYAGRWYFYMTRPSLSDSGYVWEVKNCKFIGVSNYMFKLPKRRGSFYKHSLIRIKKGIAWFIEWPDVKAASKF